MKISSKNKKIIIGVATVVGLVTFYISGLENNARNAEIQASTAPLNIQSSILENEKTLVEVNDKIKKSTVEEAKSIQLENALQTVKESNYLEGTNINKQIEQLDEFNQELDKVIDIYDKDENLNKDAVFTNKIDEIISLNSFMDDRMYEFNTKYSKEFNESMKKFPINLIAKNRGWVEMNKFTSINQ